MKSDQSYEGTFLGDSFHGHGTYKWKDKSCVYEGNFYSNSKEGYAILSMPNNSSFEGLFVGNQPFGPGILTHSNGRQDAGFWLGGKLVRLSRPVDFIIPRLATTVAGKIKLMQFKRLIPICENAIDSVEDLLNKSGYGRTHFCTPFSKTIYDYRSIFFDRCAFERKRFSNCNEIPDWDGTEESSCWERIEENLSDVFSDSYTLNKPKNSNFALQQHICNDRVFFAGYKFDGSDDFCKDDEIFSENQMGILTYYTKHGNLDEFENDLFDRDLFADFGGDDDDQGDGGGIVIKVKGTKDGKKLPPKIVSWNRGDLCTEMVKQIHRHRAFEGKLSFNVTELMSGIRTAFRKTGEKERQSLYFLKMCSLGPSKIVKELLCDGEISEELMDGRGNNGLMFAAATDQLEIIDILSDYGVDVNAFNDENLTPLNLCLLRRLSLGYEIFNWEIAFLPPVAKETIDEDLKTDDWESEESIHSLDRLFGDGMSIDESKNVKFLISSKQKCQSPSKIPIKTNSTVQRSDSSELMSKITVLNFKSLLGSQESIEEKSLPNISLLAGSTDPTPNLKIKVHSKKSTKREEYMKSIGKSNGDRYLFDLELKEILPIVEKEKKEANKDDKGKKKEEETDPELVHKLREIDETIAKLLRRGADPNISEVPKPSIHLAIFTKNPITLENLLQFGADPNRQLSSNEGLLTPLHVLVLLQPLPEYLDMCKLLLIFGADPEIETEPDFYIRKEETSFLNEIHGRTPLQLLCMRPDIEYGDPNGYVITLGLILAQVTDKKHFYNGYSDLTLAMLSGNIKLLKAFLNSGYFDPNQIHSFGTALHVLVSTYLQRKTVYENSIKMCDLLLDAGADPLLIVESPSSVKGNCVEYGYRQIDLETAERKLAGKKEKSSAKSVKGGVRDHLKDHIRVVEYLGKRIEQMRSGNLIATEGISKSRIGKGEGKSESGKKGGEDKSDSKKVKMDQAGLDDAANLNAFGTRNGEDKSGAGKIKKENENGFQRKKKKSGTKPGSDKSQKDKAGSKKPGEGDQKDLLTGNLNDLEMTDITSTSQNERSERYMALLLKSLLEMFGNCANINVDQFTLPYVVLRDGNFYYKFLATKSQRKEQYSLV